MALNWPKASANTVDQFLMPGIPFVTSSAVSAIPGRDTEDTDGEGRGAAKGNGDWFHQQAA